MINKDLLKEAIADAKAVRETALTQAKLALEEAFHPRLQSMFSAKLKEEMEQEEGLDELRELDLEETYIDEAKDNMQDDTEDDINLDEILAELESEEEESEESEEESEESEEEESEEEDKEVSELSMDELEELIRSIVSQEMGNEEEETEDDLIPDKDEEMPDEEDNLDEILAELLGDDDSDDEEEIAEAKKMEEAENKTKEELHLALETINTLHQELHEVNLLNAKLLYVNKIFKDKTLTESQKLKVVKAFDKAESTKEAKLVYESLSSTFSTKFEKSPIRENLGFASKSTGVAPKQNIVESNSFVERMQKLANIK